MRSIHLCPSLLVSLCVLLSITPAQSRGGHAITPTYAPYNEIGRDFDPRWSPDGKQIMYVNFNNNMGDQLYVVPADGGTSKRLFNDNFIYGHPSWSPDGKLIAFSSNRGGQFQIWTAKPDGTNPMQLTSIKADYMGEPRWSPDGKSLAFVSFPGPRIWITSRAGGEPTPFANGQSPSWSPDGKRIAYSSVFLTSASVTIKAIVGEETRRLQSSTTEYLGLGVPQTVDWSPDGRRLLCTKLIEGAWQATIIAVEDDRAELTTSVNGSIFFPRWSPDGKQVVFSFEDTGHPPSIQISKTDFTDRRQVTLARSFTTAQLIRYQSADGLEVPSFVYISAKPVRRKRPAIVWLHGGLGGMSGNRFDAPIQYFIDQGFVVLAQNDRSSGGFGKKLAQFGNSPEKIIDDVAAGATYLRGLSLVDGSRVGVIALASVVF
jgi:dipeptidyl aminopeptidase/acylaminoacyl peptidase